MSFAAKILADSLSPDGVRLTTFQTTFPRSILAEFNTHRMFSRNSASSRAIPVEKMIKMVMENPYVPPSWGKNQKGMQADTSFDHADDISFCEENWLHTRDLAVQKTKLLLDRGVHKQLTNRLLEPFMWHTCIVTATEWSNFFHLRNHKDAHPDIQIIARMMQELYESSEPKKLDYGEWHLPLVTNEECIEWHLDSGPGEDSTQEWKDELWRKVSVARHPDLLDDTKSAERSLGMEAGFAWGEAADVCAVYEDLNLAEGTLYSLGMLDGIERAKRRGLQPEIRRLPDNLWQKFVERYPELKRPR